MSGKYWCIVNLAPFFETPNTNKLFELPKGAVVESTGQSTIISTRGADNRMYDITWIEVCYLNSKGIQKGWVRSDFFDEYVEKFAMNEVEIPSEPTDPTDPFPYATSDPNDAPQTMVLGKHKVTGKELVKYNLCGELCAAFVTGVGIKQFLKDWKKQSEKKFTEILGNDSDKSNFDKTTITDDIKDMLKSLDFSEDKNNVAVFMSPVNDPIFKDRILSPGKFKRMLQTHYLIANVVIDGFGKLIPNDPQIKAKTFHWANHWVVLDKITPNASDGGRVEIYNPFPNRRQEYSYNEFLKSFGGGTYSGIWVKRKQEQQLLQNIGQMNRKWCVAPEDIRDMPGGSKTLINVDPGAILVCKDDPDDFKEEQGVPWRQVTYKGKKGWIRDSVLENFMDRFPEDMVVIHHPTPDEDDAKQYMTLSGESSVKHNMCGELCAAFIIGIDIDSFVEDWKVKAKNFYERVIAGTIDMPTGIDSLESMFRVSPFNAEEGDVLSFNAIKTNNVLRDPILGRALVSPGRMKKMLETHYLVAAVNMNHNDKFTGRLGGGKTNHWVVLDKVTPNGRLSGNGGWVEIYNPFPNKRQEYSYDEFMHSFAEDQSRPWFSGGLGLWVKRKDKPPVS